MNIDDKLNNMRPKDTPLLVVGYIILAMCLLIPLTATADDNVISLDQEGAELFLRIGQQGDGNDINVDLGLNYAKADNLNLGIVQKGDFNEVYFSMDGDGNTVNVSQFGDRNKFGYTTLWGAVNCTNTTFCGDIDGNNNEITTFQVNDGPNNESNTIGLHVWGNDNQITISQGCHLINLNDTSCATAGDYNDGGHLINLDQHADNGEITLSQASGQLYVNHVMDVRLYNADYSDVFWRQRGNGVKNVYLNASTAQPINVNGEQKGDGAHTATINLYGSQPSDVTLLQQGGTNQSYTLTQTCVTTGGCSVSVTQGTQ